MKKRKLKGFVLPSLYLVITICVFTSILFLSSSLSLKNKEDDYDYGVSAIRDNIKTVIVEDEITSSKIENPTEEISAKVHFYKKDDSNENQENSLIFYKNTYLKNTGVLYESDKEFLVKTIFQGKVIEINEDEIFGNCIVVEHKNNLRSYYYGIDNVEVEVNDELTTGAVLGTSKKNEISNNNNSFLIEIYYNNELVNPEEVIGTKITDYK